jgi:protein O-GlcNAc transferase
LSEQLLSVALGLAQAGRLPEAVGYYQQVLAADPRNPDALGNLGRVYHAMWNLDGAIEAFRALAAVQPTNPMAWHDLAGALFDQGCIDESVAMVRKAVQLQPQMPELHMNLGCVLMASGQFEEAWRELEWRLSVKEWGYRREFV